MRAYVLDDYRRRIRTCRSIAEACREADRLERWWSGTGQNYKFTVEDENGRERRGPGRKTSRQKS